MENFPLNQLLEFLQEVKDRGRDQFLDEAATKQGIILPVLAILGWKVFDTREVAPEYSRGKGRVDYALILGTKPAVLVEVKRAGEELANHQEQLTSYAFQEGVGIAVLTDGFIWEFYLPLLPGRWSERKVVAIDFHGQEMDQATDRLCRLLFRDSVETGEAEKFARDLHEKRERQKRIEEALPNVWKRLVEGPGEKLVELLAEETESACGFRPESEIVVKFLRDVKEVVQSRPTVMRPDTTPPRIIPTRLRPRQRGATTWAKPRSFSFLGEAHDVSTWKDVLLGLMAELAKRHPQDFEAKCLSQRGRTKPYFSRIPADLREPRRIPGSRLYAETNHSADGVVRMCHQMLNVFGYQTNEFSVVTT